jgi:hypothetical protein
MEPPRPAIIKCMSCSRKFVSPDPEHIRICARCKDSQDSHEVREASFRGLSPEARQRFFHDD